MRPTERCFGLSLWAKREVCRQSPAHSLLENYATVVVLHNSGGNDEAPQVQAGETMAPQGSNPIVSLKPQTDCENGPALELIPSNYFQEKRKLYGRRQFLTERMMRNYPSSHPSCDVSAGEWKRQEANYGLLLNTAFVKLNPIAGPMQSKPIQSRRFT